METSKGRHLPKVNAAFFIKLFVFIWFAGKIRAITWPVARAIARTRAGFRLGFRLGSRAGLTMIQTAEKATQEFEKFT
jgi:hypothetical protein